MNFTTSDGAFTALKTNMDSKTPQQIYEQWCTELAVNPIGSDYTALDGDDTAYLVKLIGKVPRPSSVADSFGFSSEGMFELFQSTPTVNATSIGLVVPNVNRAYTTSANVPRMAISFHPPYDSGSIGIKVKLTNNTVLMSGNIERNSGQVVSFALRIAYGKYFKLALSTRNGTATIPIYVFEIGANNSLISKQQLIDSIASTDGKSLVIDGSFSFGFLTGTVLDESGAPAQREVRCYSRETGQLLTKTISSINGEYTLDAYTEGEMYVVVLDDDIAPSLNALILDRIRL